MSPSLLLSVVGITAVGYLVTQGCGSSSDDNCEGRQNCTADSSGSLFVSTTTGNDSPNAGTQEHPLKTINAALARNPSRVSICEGNYAEQVKVTSAVEIVGGFDCGTWRAGGRTTTVAPTSGIPLTIRASNVAVSTLTFVAAPGTTDAPSSIAAFVSEVQHVTLNSVVLTAREGARGVDGILSPVTNPSDLNGDPSDGGTVGQARSCSCPAGGSSTGGAGGGPNLAGDPGAASPPTGRDGGAGGRPGSCSTGVGRDGSNSLAGAPGTPSEILGELTASGWVPSAGGNGQPGGPGQGGGGGAGPTMGFGAGGGGGCGSCGGAPGTGGTGGGASVALLSFSSDITLTACTLGAAKAGDGGAGAPGQSVSSPGGFGGNGANGGCQGGNGGNGGGGGAGAGGAGGPAVGVLFRGKAPQLDVATQSQIFAQEKGARGIGGAVSNCTSAGHNCGVEGRSEKMLEIGSP